MAKLQQGTDVVLPESAAVGRMSAQGTPRQVIEAVLLAQAGKLPLPVGVDLGEQGYWVGKVTQILPRDPALGTEQVMQSQYAQAIGNAEAQAYYSALKSRFKAEIKPGALAATTAPADGSR